MPTTAHSIRIDEPESGGASVMRELDNARIEIQRLRGKLGRLREMCEYSGGGAISWVCVPESEWHEVMRDYDRDDH